MLGSYPVSCKDGNKPLSPTVQTKNPLQQGKQNKYIHINVQSVFVHAFPCFLLWICGLESGILGPHCLWSLQLVSQQAWARLTSRTESPGGRRALAHFVPSLLSSKMINFSSTQGQSTDRNTVFPQFFLLEIRACACSLDSLLLILWIKHPPLLCKGTYRIYRAEQGTKETLTPFSHLEFCTQRTVSSSQMVRPTPADRDILKLLLVVTSTSITERRNYL